MYVPEPLRVLLVHPGGPYWRNKDLGAWSIPKGLVDAGEDPLAAAQREFTEETGLVAAAPFLELKPLKQKGGKLVRCWAFQGRDTPVILGGSKFEMEWPPRSGRKQTFPEVDDAQLFSVDEALRRILAGQAAFVHELHDRRRRPASP
jgi:predicted NUDIX family NTP pyrophosphohydrolase